MRDLIDRLIRLTSLRDREAMDVCLVEALRDMLGADEVQLARMLGDAGAQHWLVAAEALAGEPVRTADASWIDLRDLPAVDTQPDWLACVQGDCELARPAAGADASASLTLLPLRSAMGVVGVVQVRTALPPEETTRHAARGMLDIYRNLVATLDYTESDTLTGLLNRKSFDDTFYRASALPLNQAPEGAPERRHLGQQRYWLGVIDIDHFKQVNDQHGHLIGDEVLLLLARVMRHAFRFLDKLYRFGGEEFVVLLRCPSEADALSAMERFRRQVEAFAFPRVQHVTVSVGFTDVRSGDTPPAAVERADLAVYYAKHHGRNQVRSHAALVREGELADAAQTSDVEFF